MPCSKGEITKGLLDCKAPGVPDWMPDMRADVNPLTGIFPLYSLCFLSKEWFHLEQMEKLRTKEIQCIDMCHTVYTVHYNGA